MHAKPMASSSSAADDLYPGRRWSSAPGTWKMSFDDGSLGCAGRVFDQLWSRLWIPPHFPPNIPGLLSRSDIWRTQVKSTITAGHQMPVCWCQWIYTKAKHQCLGSNMCAVRRRLHGAAGAVLTRSAALLFLQHGIYQKTADKFSGIESQILHGV